MLIIQTCLNLKLRNNKNNTIVDNESDKDNRCFIFFYYNDFSHAYIHTKFFHASFFYTKVFNNNQLILEGLIRAMPQLTELNQLI